MSKKRNIEDAATTSKKIKTDKIGESSTSIADSFLSAIHEKRHKRAESVLDFKFNKKRCRLLSKSMDIGDRAGGILYWMSRDQRVQDNWAFLYSQRLALKLKLPLHVCFCLVPKFLEATIRHYGFMLKGLQQVEAECKKLEIQFHLLEGEPTVCVPELVQKLNLDGIVTDFSPLRLPVSWVENVKKTLPDNVPFCQIDAHNVVPAWVTSEKQEIGARTIRKKIHDKLDEYLTEFPPVIKHPYAAKAKAEKKCWDTVKASLDVDRKVDEVDWISPGTTQGLQELSNFCHNRLRVFADQRNDPNVKGLSNLSPWLHFGQIAAQRCILEVKEFKAKHTKSVEVYIEECLIRRELSDNFCLYNPNYDNVKGAPNWAQVSLQAHSTDKRSPLLSQEQLEESKTHDDLWNAAQIQLVRMGKMHGFLRMYWAKKILEWSESPEEALRLAIYFNDKYSLDGRDPSGYVGCMWSVCGIHDRAWGERDIFGKVRFMNYKGCQRKFDVTAFVNQFGARSYPIKGVKY